MQLTRGLGLEVRPEAGDGRGKGVFAKRVSPSTVSSTSLYICTRVGRGVPARRAHMPPPRLLPCEQASREGDVLFIEQPLVGMQHTSNRKEVVVCSLCFCFVGSIEGQVAHRLLHAPGERGGSAELAAWVQSRKQN